MATEIKTTALTIMKLTEGGYLVRDSYDRNLGFPCELLFACSTIEEALKYLKAKLQPKPS